MPKDCAEDQIKTGFLGKEDLPRDERGSGRVLPLRHGVSWKQELVLQHTFKEEQGEVLYSVRIHTYRAKRRNFFFTVYHLAQVRIFILKYLNFTLNDTCLF